MKISIKLLTILSFLSFAIGIGNQANAASGGQQESEIAILEKTIKNDQDKLSNLQAERQQKIKAHDEWKASTKKGSTSDPYPEKEQEQLKAQIEKLEKLIAKEEAELLKLKPALPAGGYLSGFNPYQLFGITLSAAVVVGGIVYYYYGYKSEETDDADAADVDVDVDE